MHSCAVAGCPPREMESARILAEARARVFVDASEMVRPYEKRDGTRSIRSKTEQPAFVDCGDLVGSERTFVGHGVCRCHFFLACCAHAISVQEHRS